MKLIPGSGRRHHVVRVGTVLIAAMLIAGIQGCTGTPGLQIRDWYDLDAVRDNLDGSYVLMNDLDSTTSGYEDLAGPAANGGKGWQPIGGIHAHFTGTFDGQGREIHDLFINRPDELDVALFASVYRSGTIKDVGMVNVAITGYDCVGSLVATNGGTVSNSYSIGSVIGYGPIGGLVGVNLVEVLYDGTVSDSYFTGSVSGQTDVGGLVGSNYGSVSSSYSMASVTGEGTVGGLVGYNNEDCTVSYSYSSGNVVGVDVVGGLVGTNWESIVSHSYSTGDVTGSSNVGGLLGINVGTVSSSYSSGNVVGEQDVGGLVGYNWTGGAVSNSFWDIETSGQGTSGGGIGKNTTEMQDIATFSGAGWNITAVDNFGTRDSSYIWNIVITVTYPFLSWQP
jgi:The GLUG motif